MVQEKKSMDEDSIYGPITEHPEYPVESEWRFTVTIRRHAFIPSIDTYGFKQWKCKRCGYPSSHDVHNV
jgi:hypothetical protein